MTTKNEAAKSAVLELPRSGAVVIDVPAVAKPEDVKRSRYHVGIIPGEHPFWALTFIGVTFARYDGVWTTDEHGVVIGNPQPGTVARLTDEIARQVIEDIRKCYARGVGTGDPRIVRTTDKYFEPSPRDEPMGKYLYMVALGDAGGPVRGETPQPMWTPKQAPELVAPAA
jgi:hypothetical protein